jgi:serine/threonine-protein kinase
MGEQRFHSQQGKIYRVVERLGAAGGFGSVVRVADEDGEEFALKTLHFGVPAYVLETEAENLRRVRHENVVGHVDHGTEPEAFLVMELAEGGTLKDYINEARQRGEHFPLDTVLGWSRQLLSGLHAIHAVLLHRDLKPGNVLLDGDTLKIADFGIARIAEASTRDETMKGVGTPVYMPPEGWAGPTGPSPTPAYDLYSLGIILFELATLQLPFSGDRERLRHAHLYEEPAAPRSLRDDIPPPFERLLLQLLRKTPAERGESASAALSVLDTVAAPQSAGDAGSETSEVLSRLQEGASTLMRQKTEREAEAARLQAQLQQEQERLEAATNQLEALIDEAVAVVEANVSPLRITRTGPRGSWDIRVTDSARRLAIQVGGISSPDVFGSGRAPGTVILFGRIFVTENSQTLGGANIVGYTTDAAPWVVQFQVIELRRHPLTPAMRQYEPFFLETAELHQHGQYLWGGAMHVFQHEQRELTRDVLVEWMANLLPAAS